MRSQTPIQQQRTTQTQLSRGRPHNPSITRRIQPPRQRTSPLRQMQQQTRQRTRRKGKSTPLPEKRKRTRQTTHRRHANTTHRHMVNHPPPFQQQKKRRTVKKGGGQKRREEKRKQTTRGDAMVFGDNVRARRAARALPRTPTARETKEEEKERQREEEDKRRDHTPLLHPTAIPQDSTTRQHTHHTETHTTLPFSPHNTATQQHKEKAGNTTRGNATQGRTGQCGCRI